MILLAVLLLDEKTVRVYSTSQGHPDAKKQYQDPDLSNLASKYVLLSSVFLKYTTECADDSISVYLEYMWMIVAQYANISGV